MSKNLHWRPYSYGPAFPGPPRQILCDVNVGLLERLGQPEDGLSVFEVLESDENRTSAPDLRTCDVKTALSCCN